MPEHSTEKEVEGVKVRETGHKQWEKDYTQSDMEAVSALAPPCISCAHSATNSRLQQPRGTRR